jgi:hypothetical protein
MISLFFLNSLTELRNINPRRREAMGYLAYLVDLSRGISHISRNVSGSIPACFNMARNVPSGISPGWFGIVVYRLVDLLNQIS